MDKKTIKGIDYFIYDSLEEFISYSHLGTTVKEWRDESVNVGDYIKTDLGGITKCLRILYSMKVRCITTICGTYRVNHPTQKMDNTIRSRHTRFVSAEGTQKKQNEIQLTEGDKAFARLTMFMNPTGMDAVDVYKKINPRATSELYIKQRISTITNKQGYKNFMSDEFTKILKTEGITKQWGIQKLKGIVDNKKLIILL